MLGQKECLLSRNGIDYYLLDPIDRSWLQKALIIYVTAMKYSKLVIELQEPVWRGHMHQIGTTVIGAFSSDKLVGITYGFPGKQNSWWCTQLRNALLSVGTTEKTVDDLTSDYFELTEIHVTPDMQGNGIGEELLKLLLEGQHNSHVLLSTPEVAGENNRAWKLYRKYGFHDVFRNLIFPGDHRKFAILSSALPLVSDREDENHLS